MEISHLNTSNQNTYPLKSTAIERKLHLVNVLVGIQPLADRRPAKKIAP